MIYTRGHCCALTLTLLSSDWVLPRNRRVKWTKRDLRIPVEKDKHKHRMAHCSGRWNKTQSLLFPTVYFKRKKSTFFTLDNSFWSLLIGWTHAAPEQSQQCALWEDWSWGKSQGWPGKGLKVISASSTRWWLPTQPCGCILKIMNLSTNPFT